MATYTYNNKKIAEIIKTTQFNRASLKHATGISNETTAIRWEQGEDIYTTRLCQIASYTGVPLMDFFLKDGQPLTDEDAPLGTRGPKRTDASMIINGSQNVAASQSVNEAPAPKTQTYTETDILKMQLEHQKELMSAREEYHALEIGSIKKEETIKAQVREEYQVLIAEKNQVIDDQKQTIASHVQTINDQKQTIANHNQTISEQRQTIASRDATIAQLQAELQALRAEKSGYSFGMAEAPAKRPAARK